MLLSVMVMAAALAGGEPAAPAATVAPVTAPKPKPKLVCVEEPQMGSLFKQKTCATPEEWEKRRDKDQAAMSKTPVKVPSSCSGVTC